MDNERFQDAVHTELDSLAVVQEHWPYDGPHSPETRADAAEALSALVRYLNNATMGGELGAPAQVYQLLAYLHAAAASLPQLLGQLAGWTARLGEEPTLRHDGHRANSGWSSQDQAAATGADAASMLRIAAQHAQQCQEALGTAWSGIGHLYHEDGAQ